MGISFGGNKSKSSAKMNQDVWGPQGDALQQAYGNYNDLYQQSMPYMNMGMGMSEQAMPYMQHAADAGKWGGTYLGRGGAYGNVSGMRDDLYGSLQSSMQNPSSTGQMYESIMGGEGNTYADPLVNYMRDDAAENLARMKATTGLDASAMGQGGSNRHAIENAVQGRGALSDLLGAQTGVRYDTFDKDLDWKMDIARQADAQRGAAQDRAMGVLGGQDQNVLNSMQYQPIMQNLGMGMMAPNMQAMMMPFMAMNQMAQAYGDPTVLSSGSQSGKGGGFGFGFGRNS